MEQKAYQNGCPVVKGGKRNTRHVDKGKPKGTQGIMVDNHPKYHTKMGVSFCFGVAFFVWALNRNQKETKHLVRSPRNNDTKSYFTGPQDNLKLLPRLYFTDRRLNASLPPQPCKTLFIEKSLPELRGQTVLGIAMENLDASEKLEGVGGVEIRMFEGSPQTSFPGIDAGNP